MTYIRLQVLGLMISLYMLTFFSFTMINFVGKGADDSLVWIGGSILATFFSIIAGLFPHQAIFRLMCGIVTMLCWAVGFLPLSAMVPAFDGYALAAFLLGFAIPVLMLVSQMAAESESVDDYTRTAITA